MALLTLCIQDQNGMALAEESSEDEVNLNYCSSYTEGSSIVFKTSQVRSHYVIQVDDALGSALVYVTKPEVVYTIPFGEKKNSYSPKTFSGSRHLLSARAATREEICAYRNLAVNVMDQHGDTGCFPHAAANVETRGEAAFAARNAIDGVKANLWHGVWPYESWGINRRDDAEFTLEFGRKVTIDRIALYTRADFPHDNWWVQATFTFSDGTEQTVKMDKQIKPHIFVFEPKQVEWIKLGKLIKADDPSPFPALTQIEVYGVPVD